MAREIFGRSSLRRTSSSRSFCAPAGVMGTGSFILPRAASLPVVSGRASLVLRPSDAPTTTERQKAAKSGPVNLRPKRNAASRGLEHADIEGEHARVEPFRPEARNSEGHA